MDEVLVSFMQAPHTFTREDTVEINCHSGIFALRMILNMVLEAGSRLAEPGEFTRRAFINGRIDLSQAESILNIIRARSEKSVKAAAQNITGGLSSRVGDLREKLSGIAAVSEALLDFPEEVEEDQGLLLQQKKDLDAVKAQFEKMLRQSESSRLYQSGVPTVIIGKPNVGKSSLLNAILGHERAIVNEMPGTTRDILEGSLLLGGYTIRLIDTAGIHTTDDPVEREGIERSRGAVEQARLILAVFDSSSPWSKEDEAVAELLRGDQLKVAVLNKTDMEVVTGKEELANRLPGVEIVETAAIKNRGITLLEKMVTDILDRAIGVYEESLLLISMRHAQIVQDVLDCINRALALIEEDRPLELIAHEIREGLNKLGAITGETVNDDILDKIFSEFCLGK